MAQLQRDELHDSTSLINVGQSTIRSFTQMSIGRLHASAWKSYPKRYKFFGLQINASDEKIIYTRQSYDLFSFLAYIGGIALVLFVLGSAIVSCFARTNLNAMLGNKLYTWIPPPSLMRDAKRADSKMEIYEHTLFRKQREDIEYAKKLAGKGKSG